MYINNIGGSVRLLFLIFLISCGGSYNSTDKTVYYDDAITGVISCDEQDCLVEYAGGGTASIPIEHVNPALIK